jgi:uncharacterized protein (DUF305 family)
VTDDRGRGIRLTIAASITALVLVVGAFFGGLLLGGQAAPPTTVSVEAGFARDMQAHHQQAVEMSMTVRELTDAPDVDQLAYDIATAQSQQAGQMYGWLSSWGLPQAPAEPAMTWMTRETLDQGSGHGHAAGSTAHEPGGPMPGMASMEQLNELRAASGVEAERRYLRLMIDHHLGGVEMAEAVLERTEEPVVTALARSIVKSQTAEIAYLEELLAARP